MSEFASREEIVTIESLWLDENPEGDKFLKLNVMTKEFGKITCKTTKTVEEEKKIAGIVVKKKVRHFISVTDELPPILTKIASTLAEKGSVRVRMKFREWNKRDEDKIIRFVQSFNSVKDWVIVEGEAPSLSSSYGGGNDD